MARLVRAALCVPLLALFACATSPTGRSQLKLFPDAEVARMGAVAYDKMKSEMTISNDPAKNRMARCVASAIAAEVQGPYAGTRWEVTVFQDESPNAFALPGGKIGVNTGLFQLAKNQDQLATVLGHEVAHVLADHGNERISNQYAAQSGLQVVQVLSGASTPAQQQLIGLLGAGAQVGVLLPFSRTQESEADQMGLDLMARAGFDPAASIALWQNMASAGGGQPPEFLSTHPSHGTRIQQLEARLPAARQLSEAARARGKRPACG